MADAGAAAIAPPCATKNANILSINKHVTRAGPKHGDPHRLSKKLLALAHRIRQSLPPSLRQPRHHDDAGGENTPPSTRDAVRSAKRTGSRMTVDVCRDDVPIPVALRLCVTSSSTTLEHIEDGGSLVMQLPLTPGSVRRFDDHEAVTTVVVTKCRSGADNEEDSVLLPEIEPFDLVLARLWFRQDWAIQEGDEENEDTTSAATHLYPRFDAGGGVTALDAAFRLSKCDKTGSPVAFPIAAARKAVPVPPLESTDNKSHQYLEIPLRLVVDASRTGLPSSSGMTLQRGTRLAGRYVVLALLGEAAFSRAVHCIDLFSSAEEDPSSSSASRSGWIDEAGNVDDDGVPLDYAERGCAEVCIKVIHNTKDFFDQSLDEIKLLKYIQTEAEKRRPPSLPDNDPWAGQSGSDVFSVLHFYDAFYFQGHMMLVTELLSDNLYDYQKYCMQQLGGPPRPVDDDGGTAAADDDPPGYYYSCDRIRRIGRQILEALAFIHSIGLIHCDLKPENVMFQSHSRCIVKVIDFGSSCFTGDRPLSTYVQSRSYRAPEVCLGAVPYDGRIDVWSLGCMLFEMATSIVLFEARSISEMLARIAATVGPLPRELLLRSQHTDCVLTEDGVFFSGCRGDPLQQEEALDSNDQRFELYSESDSRPRLSRRALEPPGSPLAVGAGEEEDDESVGMRAAADGGAVKPFRQTWLAQCRRRCDPARVQDFLDDDLSDIRIALHFPTTARRCHSWPRPERRSPHHLWHPDMHTADGRIEGHLRAAGFGRLDDDGGDGPTAHPHTLLLDAIYSALVPDPTQRPTAAELLSHPFFRTA